MPEKEKHIRPGGFPALLALALLLPGCDAMHTTRKPLDYPGLRNSEIRKSIRRASKNPLIEKPVDSALWPEEHDTHLRKYSKRYFGVGFDWKWFKAQAVAESRLTKSARGPAGAVGIMQIMPETFSRNDNQIFLESSQERWHIAVAIQYNRWLWERWAPALKPEERLPFTFASYNCGRGTMLRASYLCGGCLDWRRVRRFVPDITRHYLIKIKALMGVRQN